MCFKTLNHLSFKKDEVVLQNVYLLYYNDVRLIRLSFYRLNLRGKYSPHNAYGI